MFYTILTMIAKTRLIFLTVIVASLTLGLAADITANAFMTQSASARAQVEHRPTAHQVVMLVQEIRLLVTRLSRRQH